VRKNYQIKYLKYSFITYCIKVYKYILIYNKYMLSQRSNKIIDDEVLKIIKNNNKFNVDETTQFIISNCKDIDRDIITSRVDEIYNNRKILTELIKIPEIKQRTEEWFEARKTRLTASDLYDAIKKSNVSNVLAKKKAKIVVDNINYNAIPALKWGTMFESMASRCYSHINNNINIYDFGLICDKKNEHFGASPDGINELGIMIEIKCPYSRKIIDGFIPEKYKLQIQGQLAVCNLSECDYVECQFKTFDSEELYLEELDKDIDYNHGIIAEYINKNGEYYYIYSDENIKPTDCIENINILKNNFNLSNDFEIRPKFNKFIYWKLVEINTQRVKFDIQGWEKIVPKINEFWDKVEQYKLMPIENIIKKFKFIDDNDD